MHWFKRNEFVFLLIVPLEVIVEVNQGETKLINPSHAPALPVLMPLRLLFQQQS